MTIAQVNYNEMTALSLLFFLTLVLHPGLLHTIYICFVSQLWEDITFSCNFSFQLHADFRGFQRGEPERWPEVLLHEPVWEVPGPATHTLETGGADSENRHDHNTGM